MQWAGLEISKAVYKLSNCEVFYIAQMAAGSTGPWHVVEIPHPLAAMFPQMQFLPVI